MIRKLSGATWTCGVLAALLWHSLPVAAQSPGPMRADVDRAAGDSVPQRAPDSASYRRHSLIVAGTRHSPFVTREGVKRRDAMTVLLRRAWRRGVAEHAVLEQTVDLMPLAFTTHNPVAIRGDACPRPQGLALAPCERLEYDEAYGVGAAPLGFQLLIFPDAPLAIVLGASAGAIVFNRPVPDPSARRINLLAEGGIGIEIRIGERRSLVTAYRQTHLSNAGTAEANPGLNSGMLQLGYSVRSR